MTRKVINARWLLNLITREDGGAYTLSYVMVIPILMLLTCIIIETTLMMSAKIGTSYSAFSAARTASVWSSANKDWSEVETRIERAAVQSFVPFASGLNVKGSAPNQISEYVKSYREFVDNPVSDSYVRNKYANAMKSLTVKTQGPPTNHDSDITITVEYRFRFNIPGVGKLLGEKDGDGYFFRLKSIATLQNEGPKNKSQDLGIGYGTFN